MEKEIKRRADAAGNFSNEGVIIRLTSAVLLDADDAWQLQHRYVWTEAMAELTLPTIDAAATQIAAAAA